MDFCLYLCQLSMSFTGAHSSKLAVIIRSNHGDHTLSTFLHYLVFVETVTTSLWQFFYYLVINLQYYLNNRTVFDQVRLIYNEQASPPKLIQVSISSILHCELVHLTYSVRVTWQKYALVQWCTIFLSHVHSHHRQDQCKNVIINDEKRQTDINCVYIFYWAQRLKVGVA